MTNELKNIIALPYVTRAYVSDNGEGKHALLETVQGGVFIVSQVNRFGGVNFEMGTPIVPNIKSGSTLGIDRTGYTIQKNKHSVQPQDPYWEPLEVSEVVDRLKRGTSATIPQYFTVEERESVRYETLEGAVKRHGNILQYVSVKP